MFAVAGTMQGALLVMCIIWTFRQRRLGIDDFGNLLSSPDSTSNITRGSDSDGGVPGLVAEEDEDPAKMRAALEAALESAVEADLMEESGVRETLEGVGEETPLLAPSQKEVSGGGGWLGWLVRL
jgi:hypothetical protein